MTQPYKMRRNIVHAGAGYLSYAIREIVQVGYRLRKLGLDVTWENIGDPVQKGEAIAPWIREILQDVVARDESWAYSDTAGVPAAREFPGRRGQPPRRGEDHRRRHPLLQRPGRRREQGLYPAAARGPHHRPQPGLQHALLRRGGHSGSENITFALDPHNGWLPDLDELRQKVKYNESIAGILLINPDNPTGLVYPREVLEAVVGIAREFNLFLVIDEIYVHIVYNGYGTLHLSEVIGDVCAIVMRGISKEYPWPGARCGWIEILNRDQDPTFHTYANSLLAAKRLEVCSTPCRR